ncbi:MAG TPA: DUF1844 domain-containing protein [Pyrinomonadaceae bacterium]|nr:DUF1844 domain-containing protein [Pyrinomonadaceae bacterium]
MSDEQPNFKVTDRRLFNADGSPRELPPEEKLERETAASGLESETSSSAERATSTAASAPSEMPPTRQSETEQQANESAAADEDELLDAENPAGFVNFIMSIASNAASSLGMMEHPVTHKREVDLELAKHWIDILGMLQQKTRGNLVSQEERILEGLLSDLRMQYVSLANSTSPKAAGAYTGRDITGG